MNQVGNQKVQVRSLCNFSLGKIKSLAAAWPTFSSCVAGRNTVTWHQTSLIIKSMLTIRFGDGKGSKFADVSRQDCSV